MKLGRNRFLNVIAAVEGLRDAHPELAAPLTATSLATVLERERIRLMRLPIEAKAYVIGLPPAFTIVVDSQRPSRYHTRWAAHELGHIKLHFGDEAISTQTRRWAPDDPIELEAELFARLLLKGPAATPEHPAIAPLIAALVGGEARRRTPAQLSLEWPEPRVTERRAESPGPSAVSEVSEPPPRAAGDTGSHDHEDSLTSLTYWRRYFERQPRRPWTRIDRNAPLSQDLVRIKFYDETMRASRFIDRDGRWWWMYNFKVATAANGRRRRVRVRDFMSRDIQYRVFVNSLGQPRVYHFHDRRENRDYRVKHLERQLAEAKPIRTVRRRDHQAHVSAAVRQKNLEER